MTEVQRLTLGEMQEKFSLMIAKLVIQLYDRGYKVRWGEVLRTQSQAEANASSGAGILHSLHLLKLAADLTLTKDGVVLTKTEEYTEAGLLWEAAGGSWGGRFHSRPDGNHFSLEYQGVR